MARNDHPTEDEPNINVLSQLPSRPFSLTMEVPLFLLMTGITLSGAVIYNILLDRTCLHALNYTKEQCDLLHATGEKSNETHYIEQESQKYASMVSMIRSIIEAVCPAFLSLFLGVWSDTYGRKPLVVWPLFGMAISSMIMVAYSLVNNLGPWWYILTAVPISLSGGLSALFTGAFSHVSDITSHESRSFRLALLEAAIFMGTILGSILSPYLVNLIGNVMVLYLHAVIYVVAYAFTNIYIVESLNGALQGGLSTVLDLLLVKEMMETCFKKRPNNLRMITILLVLANSLSIFILYGLVNLDYLYTRQKLDWALKDYTIFNASNTIIMIVGLLIGVTFIQKICKMGDMLLTIVSYLSSIADVMIRAFATKTWHMYLGGSISLFRGLAAPLTRSLLTKILPIEDITKVFALSCAMDAIFPVFSPIVYNTMYAHTISTFPGVIYLLSAFIYGSCVVMMGVIQYYLCRNRRLSYSAIG